MLDLKKTIVLLLCGLCSALAMCQTDTSSTGTICIMRSTGFTASARNFKLFIDGKLACKIPNRSYVLYTLPSGAHSIAVQMSGKEQWPNTEKLEVPVEAGKTAYVAVAMSSGLVDNHLELNMVSEKNALTRMIELKPNPCQGQ